jgi:hypothetical protein
MTLTYAVHLPAGMTRPFFSARMRRYAYQNSKEPCTVFQATKEHLEALKARIAQKKANKDEAYWLKLHYQGSAPRT